ncbi:MAG: SDR family oxidoreductase [Candidatus Eremiobacteraeota bacterium]|nr:SDR family oxidoreductase [Candidatus Eremiobacteraeota bacterium]
MSRRKALITGASGGIGLELAKLLAAGGYDLVLAARSGDALESIAADLQAEHAIGVQVISQDLGVAGSAQAVYDAAGACDILVNNAGFATSGKFADVDLDLERSELQLNIVTLTELTKLSLPGMIARKWGRVLNVASTAAFQPGPFMAVYYASKAYVLSFSEAIASELRGTGVTVTCLAPGATQTGFAMRGGVEKTPLFKIGVADARSVAKAGYDGLFAGKSLVVPGFKNKAIVFSTRFAPRKLLTKISGGLIRRGS